MRLAEDNNGVGHGQHRDRAVGTVNKSIAAMSWMCCFRNVVYDGEVEPRSLGRYFSIVDLAISIPSF